MIRSKNDLKIACIRVFQNESYIPQLFYTRKFSPRELKCLKGVIVRNWDGQYL